MRLATSNDRLNKLIAASLLWLGNYNNWENKLFSVSK